MKQIRARYLPRLTAWLHRPTHPWSLALFRIVVGACVAFEAHHNQGRLTQYTPDQWHLPYGVPAPPLSLEHGLLLCQAQGVLGVLLALGVAPRAAAALALGCQGWLFLVSQLNFRNHVFLLLVALACLALTPCAERLSPTGWLAARWRARSAGDNPDAQNRRFAGLGVRLFQAQVFAVYLWSGLHKLMLGFGDGYPLCVFLGRELRRGLSERLLSSDFAGARGAALLESANTTLSRTACAEGAPTWVGVASALTIGLELGLAAALLHRRTVLPAALLGICFHASILLAMDVYTFGLLMVGSYALFYADPIFGSPGTLTHQPPAQEEAS